MDSEEGGLFVEGVGDGCIDIVGTQCQWENLCQIWMQVKIKDSEGLGIYHCKGIALVVTEDNAHDLHYRVVDRDASKKGPNLLLFVNKCAYTVLQ